MITLAKLCQLTGISRRMLQDYDALGLLTHCAETPGGYWLYAEESLERLALIQLLRQVGYTRQELLLLLGTQDTPVKEQLLHVQESLLTRRHQIGLLLHCISTIRQPLHTTEDAPLSSFLNLLEATQTSPDKASRRV